MKLDAMKPFRPDKEELQTYLQRVRKTARVLAAVGSPMQDGSVEVLQMKAEIELQLHEEAYGDRDRQTRILRRIFTEELFQQQDEAGMEAPYRLWALEGIFLPSCNFIACVRIILPLYLLMISSPSILI